MIIRSWKARAAGGKFETYARHFRDAVVPELAAVPGHAGAYLLRRTVGAHVEVVVLTLWDSMEAIAKFAGPVPERAVVAPVAAQMLEAFDTTVEHFEVAFDSTRRSP